MVKNSQILYRFFTVIVRRHKKEPLIGVRYRQLPLLAENLSLPGQVANERASDGKSWSDTVGFARIRSHMPGVWLDLVGLGLTGLD